MLALRAKKQKQVFHFLSQTNYIMKNYSEKYIPLRNLKFEDIGYYQPVSKIYENGELKNKQSFNKFLKMGIKPLSAILYLNLLFNPLKLDFIFPLVSNILLQPYLVYKYFNIRKSITHKVRKVYLLKNGHQILIITQDEAVHLVNIKDITKSKDLKNDVKMFRTFDKEFLIDLGVDINSKKVESNLINEDIISAIEDKRIVDTSTSYANYHRLTIPKVERGFRKRLYRRVINYKFDKMERIKYLSSYNRFILLKHQLNGNNFIKFYYMKEERKPAAEPKEMTKMKRKLNIHMYTNDKFQEAFGMELYKYLALVNSLSESNSEKDKERLANLLNLIKRPSSEGRGRTVKPHYMHIYNN